MDGWGVACAEGGGGVIDMLEWGVGIFFSPGVAGLGGGCYWRMDGWMHLREDFPRPTISRLGRERECANERGARKRRHGGRWLAENLARLGRVPREEVEEHVHAGQKHREMLCVEICTRGWSTCVFRLRGSET